MQALWDWYCAPPAPSDNEDNSDSDSVTESGGDDVPLQRPAGRPAFLDELHEHLSARMVTKRAACTFDASDMVQNHALSNYIRSLIELVRETPVDSLQRRRAVAHVFDVTCAHRDFVLAQPRLATTVRYKILEFMSNDGLDLSAQYYALFGDEPELDE